MAPHSSGLPVAKEMFKYLTIFEPHPNYSGTHTSLLICATGKCFTNQENVRANKSFSNAVPVPYIPQNKGKRKTASYNVFLHIFAVYIWKIGLTAFCCLIFRHISRIYCNCLHFIQITHTRVTTMLLAAQRKSAQESSAVVASDAHKTYHQIMDKVLTFLAPATQI